MVITAGTTTGIMLALSSMGLLSGGPALMPTMAVPTLVYFGCRIVRHHRRQRSEILLKDMKGAIDRDAKALKSLAVMLQNLKKEHPSAWTELMDKIASSGEALEGLPGQVRMARYLITSAVNKKKLKGLRFVDPFDKFKRSYIILRAACNLRSEVSDCASLIRFLRGFLRFFEALDNNEPLETVQHVGRATLERDSEGEMEPAEGAEEVSQAYILTGAFVTAVNIVCFIEDTLDLIQFQPQLADDLRKIGDQLDPRLARRREE